MDNAIDFSRMPDSAPPDDLWPAITGELDRRGRRRFVQRLSALAAMVTVVVLATVLLDAPPGPGPGYGPDPVAGQGAGASEVTLAELRAQSAVLEASLSRQRQRVVDGAGLESLIWLETELAWLDEQIMDDPDDRGLWRERVGLLIELNRRYAEGDWQQGILLASV